MRFLVWLFRDGNNYVALVEDMLTGEWYFREMLDDEYVWTKSRHPDGMRCLKDTRGAVQIASADYLVCIEPRVCQMSLKDIWKSKVLK